MGVWRATLIRRTRHLDSIVADALVVGDFIDSIDPKRTFERLPFDAVISCLAQRQGERLDGGVDYRFIEARIAEN
jgi:hypothetical protein